MSDRDEWRWTDEQGVQRLVRTEELRAAIAGRVLPGSTLVWREGMREWLPAFTVPEFADAAPTGDGGPEIDGASHEPRAAGGMPEGRPRPAMQTLLGMDAPPPEVTDRNSSPNAPIVVPGGPGASLGGRSPITLRPTYGSSPGAGTTPEIPRPARTPAEAPAATLPSPPPMVTSPPAQAQVDKAWNVDEETTTGPNGAKATQKSGSTPAPGPVRPAAVPSPVRAPSVTRKTSALTGLPEGSPAAKPAPAGSVTPKVSPVGPALGKKPETTAATSVSRLLPKVDLQKAKEGLARPASTEPQPAGAARSVAEKLPAPPRPGAAPKAAAAPRTPVPPAAGDTAPPPPPAQPLPVVELPPAPRPPADTTALPEMAPAPLPAAAAQEPSTTAILPPDLPPTGTSKPLSELSKTVLISGLLGETTAPLPDKDTPAAPAASSTAASPPEAAPPQPGPGLPSDKGAEYPPLSTLMHAPGPTQGPVDANAASMSRLAATTTSPRAPSVPAPAPAPAPPSPAAVAPAAQLSEPVSVPVASLIAAGAALITMVIGAFFVGRCSTHDARPVAQARIADIVRERREAIPDPPKPCWVAKQPVRWAPTVSRSIPFELLPNAAGNVVIGYARSSDEAAGIEITPATGQLSETFSEKVTGEIERVSPTGVDKGFFVSTNEQRGALRSAVQVPATKPFFVGLAEGAIVTADGLEGPVAQLWPLATGGGLEAARVQIAGDRGYALTFRREGAIWGGWISAERKPSGELVKIVGSGGQVGKPVLGWNGRELAVVFADRPDDASPYKIRLGHAAAGSIPAETTVIELPAGGPGGDAFAPGIAGLPDGRWLLVWTEGAAGSRAVRAQTMGPDFAPVGDPIALSPPAGNFGQGILGVAGRYVTAVFLSKGKSSYELWGGILQCG